MKTGFKLTQTEKYIYIYIYNMFIVSFENMYNYGKQDKYETEQYDS